MSQASLIIIGDEILSGRTEDKNLAYLAKWLGKLGINLSEVRVVLDDEEEIIEAVNALRKKYDYVFTTGGIGPTHDDITTESVAKAFGVETRIDDDALEKMREFLAGKELTEGLVKSKSVCIAYETVTDNNGRLPLLAPMSAVAGRMSIQAGAHSLEKNQKGRGILLGGAPGGEPANVVILGGGVVGENAAIIATGMKAKVHIVDKSEERLKQLVQIFGDKIIP